MAVTTNVTRRLQDNAPEIAGGMVGVGAPVTLREFADEEVGPLLTGRGDLAARLTRPSVLWGLGAGTVTGVLWWMGVGPDMLEDFYLAHTLTGIPTGIASAAVPKQTGGGGGGGGDTQAAATRTGRTAMRTDGNDEFDHADGAGNEFAESE